MVAEASFKALIKTGGLACSNVESAVAGEFRFGRPPRVELVGIEVDDTTGRAVKLAELAEIGTIPPVMEPVVAVFSEGGIFTKLEGTEGTTISPV